MAPHCTLQSLAVLVAVAAQEPLEDEEVVVLALVDFGEEVADGESDVAVSLGFESLVSGSSSFGLSS